MGKPLSLDLRSRLVGAVVSGMSRRAAAERFGVGAATAVRWVHAANTTGSLCAKISIRFRRLVPREASRWFGQVSRHAIRRWVAALGS
jgi:transposase